MPGERLLSMLGPNTVYRNIGLVRPDGSVVLWKKHRDSPFYQWVKSFMEDPQRYADSVEVNFEGRCLRCNRLLTTPESVEKGIGPICEGRM